MSTNDGHQQMWTFTLYAAAGNRWGRGRRRTGSSRPKPWRCRWGR